MNTFFIEHAKGKRDLDMIIKLPDDGETGSPKRRKRAAFEDQRLKWPNSVVPFEFAETNEICKLILHDAFIWFGYDHSKSSIFYFRFSLRI